MEVTWEEIEGVVKAYYGREVEVHGARALFADRVLLSVEWQLDGRTVRVKAIRGRAPLWRAEILGAV